MSRVIKFRAWWPDEKIMEYDFGHDLGRYLSNGTELMQFTGLLDKNGREIYEGDIVKALIDATEENHYGEEFDRGYWIGEVVYQGCGYHIKQRDDKYTPTLNNICITSLEIIGNIYENQDLLEQADEPQGGQR